MHDGEGRLSATVAVCSDLTDALAERTRAEEDRRRMADAQASAHLGSYELDLDTGDVIGSDELWRILARPPSDLADLAHVHPEDRAELRAALRRAERGEVVSCTHRIVRPGGTVRWVTTRSSPRPGPGARTLIGTVFDITERYEAQQALLHQANHDPLTGLANRRLFLDHLEAALADPATSTTTTVVLIDLDDFRLVNDRLGHLDADEALRHLAQRIVATTPGDGIVGRLGGDEFVVCFTGCDDLPAVAAAVDRIIAAVRRDLDVAGTSLVVESSAGVARSAPGATAGEVLRQADAAVYAAKQAGRGRWELYDDALDDRQRRRVALAEALHGAVEREEVATHFQPEVDLATGALFGFEALARWHHPELGAIRPDEFVPIAEEARLIGPLGALMLTNACDALARWRRRRPDLALTVAVNVSPLQLADPGFPDQVRDALVAAGVPPTSLCLEVTESTLMDSRSSLASLRRLHDHGVQIAIDDFGTGYSSFSRLRDVPVDFLKVDQSFVSGIGEEGLDDVIITTMVALASSLGVQTIAEGIETEDQHRVLAGLRCSYGQGYLWGRPQDAAATTELVDRWPLVASPPPSTLTGSQRGRHKVTGGASAVRGRDRPGRGGRTGRTRPRGGSRRR